MSALRITCVEEIADRAWDHAFERSPGATWFQSRAWAEVWRDYTGGRLRPVARRVVFSDGSSVCVPASEMRSRSGRRVALQLSAGGGPGGWLANENVEKPHADQLAEWLCAEPGVAWRVNPFDPIALERLSARDEAKDPTWLLPLSEGFDAVHRGFSKGHRAAARRAEREGVSVAPAIGDDDWEGYLAAYASSVARWGERTRTVYPARFFAILRTRCPGESLRLWVAKQGHDVVAGALVFDAPAHQVYWHGAMRRDAQPGAVHLLLRTVIENACREGAEVFDFNPCGGLTGVATFKKGFGARPQSCPLVRTPPLGRLARWFGRGSA